LWPVGTYNLRHFFLHLGALFILIIDFLQNCLPLLLPATPIKNPYETTYYQGEHRTNSTNEKRPH
jgi:hypothetical protein